MSILALRRKQNEERNLKRKRDDEDKDDQDDTAQENDNLPKEWKTSRNHPLDNIIDDISISFYQDTSNLLTRHIVFNLSFPSLQKSHPPYSSLFYCPILTS